MILILNGSPNKDSATMTISNDLIKKSKEEVIIINTYDLNITSCDDCKYCSKTRGTNYFVHTSCKILYAKNFKEAWTYG